MKLTRGRLRRELKRRLPPRQYLPYLVPGLAPLLEHVESVRRRFGRERSLADLERMTPARTDESYRPCPLCGADRVRMIHHHVRRAEDDSVKWDYRAGRCVECGLLYRVPCIMPSYIPARYSGRDYSEFLEGPYRKGRAERYRRTLQAFAPLLDEGNGRRLLDFGCGTGIFLELALERGFDAVGVDLSPDAVRVATDRLGPRRAWWGDPLDTPELAAGGFGVITLWSVLAHIADPVARLTMLRSLLAPDGVLLVYTVNAQSLELKAFGGYWAAFEENHVAFWEPATLTPLLRRAGFRSVAYRPFYGQPIEMGSDGLSAAQRARIVRHIDRSHSGQMMRAVAFNGPTRHADISGALPL